MATVPALPDESEFTKGFADVAATLDSYVKTLRGMEDGPLKASIALQYAKEAQRYLDAVDNSELKAHVSRLYQEHRRASGWLKRVRAPGEVSKKYFDDTRSNWESKRHRLIEEERRKKEQEANLFAAQQRKAEIVHLRKIGKTAEAEARAAAPIVPITVNVDPDMGKPEGEVMVEVWQPQRDESGNIVFSDLTAYLTWIAANPAMQYLIDHKYGKLKKLLTDNRGLIQPPGMEIEHKFEPRTRRESDE
jgi:predicted DNA-binding WGR domain protein